MSSKGVIYIGPTMQDPSIDTEVWTDGPTHALLVKMVNPGGGGGGGTEFLEDTPHVSGDAGNMPLAVRKDTPGSLVSTDGDYAPLQVDASGALRVVMTGGGGGGTEFAEDSPHASGALGTLALVVRKDVQGTLAGTDGDYAPLQVDAQGKLRVLLDPADFPDTFPVTQVTSPWASSLPGTVSSGNSTTTPLAGSGTFTGVFEEVKDFAMVTVTVFADVASATDGMKLQWSGNGTDVDREEAITIAAGSAGGRALALNVRGRYFRVVYTNGGAAQTTFRLGTVYHVAGTGLNNVVIAQDIPLTALAILTRSVITGETTAGGGSFVNVKVSPSGAVQVGGSVDVATVIPGTGATNLGKAEDAVHASGDVGVMPLAVRSDVASGIAANGDYHPLLVDAVGRLHTNVGEVTPGFAATNLGKRADDTYASAHVGVMALAVRGSDYVPLRLDNNDALRCTVEVLQPGTTALDLGKAEDAVHASGDVGVMSLAVRSDTAAATAANGDYHPLLTDSLGRLHTNVGVVTPGSGLLNLGKAWNALPSFGGDIGVAMLTIDGTALTWQPLISDANVLRVQGTVNVGSVLTSVVPGTAATNLGKAEDAAHTTGDVGVMALAVRNDSMSVLAGTTGDYVPLMTNSQGRLVVVVPETINVNVLDVVPGSDADNLGKKVDGAFASLDVGVMALAVRSSDATYRPLTLDNNDALTVSAIVTSVAPGTGPSQLGKQEDAAHTTADVGVMALAVRQDTLANSTSADADYAALKVDNLGALYVNMGNPTSLADGQLANSLGVLFTSSGRTRVESIDIFNTSSTLTETVQLNLQQSGGTSRQVRQYTLGPKESISVIEGDCWNLENGDEIEGFTTTATTVNYFITGVVR